MKRDRIFFIFLFFGKLPEFEIIIGQEKRVGLLKPLFSLPLPKNGAKSSAEKDPAFLVAMW